MQTLCLVGSVVIFVAYRVQLPVEREGVSTGHKALLPEFEVPPGNAPTPFPHPRGETVLPHSHEAPQNRVCSDQTLLLYTGKSLANLQLFSNMETADSEKFMRESVFCC